MQGPTGNNYRVLQIHPTLRCNLKCLHCYSSSGPEEKEELSLDLLRQAVSDAFAEGYNVVSLSGGEPLMFSPLRELLQHARSLGMLTTVTTNGMLLTQKRLRDLREVVDLIAISLDGVGESHDLMRASPRAFETMKQRLDDVRKANIPFGFIFTLTMHNLHELEEVARFAVEQGAALLQVHPLEEAGRAEDMLVDSAPDELELAYAFLEVGRVRKIYSERLQIQLDVVDRELVRANPERVYAAEPMGLEDFSQRPLAELVAPLIIEHDGFIVPVQYGFSHTYGLGNLKDGSLRQHAAAWKTNLYLPFLRLCQQVFDKLIDADKPELPFTNWYGKIMQSSYKGAPVNYLNEN
ncbi:MAG: radical SAM protein [Pyrinomonadaceae bacterium]